MTTIDTFGPLGSGMLALWLTQAAPAQPPIVVQGGGPALQQAIDTAPPNAILDVFAATYDPILVQQPLTIACRPGVLIVGGVSTPAATIDSLPAGSTFALTRGECSNGGMSIHQCAGAVVVVGTRLSPGVPSQLAIAQCSGPVVLRDVQFHPLVYTTIQNCAQVSLRSCVCGPLQFGTSQVLLTNCSVPPYLAGAAIRLTSGDLTIVGGSYAGVEWAGFPIDPPAVEMSGGRLTLTGSTTLAAATFWAANFPPNPQTPAVAATGGEVYVDPSTHFVTLNPNPVVAPVVVGGHVPYLDTTWMVATSVLQIAIVGEPGSLVITAVSAPVTPLEVSFGELWLDPAAYLVLDAGLLPSGGTRTLSIQVPPLPPFLVLPLQSVAFPTGGGIRLGAPATFVFG